MLPAWYRGASTFTAIITICCLALLVHQWREGMSVEADLRALFPVQRDDPFADKADERLAEWFGNRLVIAVRGPDRDQATRAADLVVTGIDDSGFMRLLETEQLQAVDDQRHLLQDHRFQLLTPAQRAQLEAGDLQEIRHRAQAALLGLSAITALDPHEDPLALHSEFAKRLQPVLPGEMVGNRLRIDHGGFSYVIVGAQLTIPSFSLHTHDKVRAWVEDRRQRLLQEAVDAELLLSGAVFHAAEASAAAKRDVVIISLCSSFGILILYLLTFRRLKPLLLGVASVAFGSLVAVVFNHVIFGYLHLMTLVFGASLIGVAVDYSVHYLCRHQAKMTHRSAFQRKHILDGLIGALALGLITTLLGYGCLLQANLPGLQQIASFSMIGLAAAWLFVITVFPIALRTPLPHPTAVILWLTLVPWEALRSLRRHRWFWWGIPVLAVILGLALSQLRLSDDVRVLYKPSTALVHSEETLQKLLQGVGPNQFFLIRAESEEALLQKEERFSETALNPLVEANALSGYSALTQIVPSRQTQWRNYSLLNDRVYKNNALAEQFMRTLGFDEATIDSMQRQFTRARTQSLRLREWLSVARPDQQMLWLGKIDGSVASMVVLRGIADVNALRAAAAPVEGVVWIDKVATLSVILKQLQASAIKLLGSAYLAVLALMWLYFRQLQALLLVSIPLLATATALAVLAFFNVSINVFHIFGCFLILGLGMDYGIFASQPESSDDSCRRAIFLSAITSALSFGLLILSTMPMVRAFGATLLMGSVMNWVLAAIIGPAVRDAIYGLGNE